MKTVLVTGAAGFIGSNFVHYLQEKHPEYRILVLDNLTYAGHIENLPAKSQQTDRYEFWYGNVDNAELVDSLVSRSDAVVHFAAESSVTRSIYGNRLFLETDVLGTQTVANAVTRYSGKVERFIHISSSEVYGTAEAALMDEDHPLKPMSPYAAAKCGADRLVYSYYTTYKIPAIIVRPFNNYGPRQHLEKLVPRLITSCLMHEPLSIHGDGSAARDWLYVRDHCEALDRILHAPRERLCGEVLNIGTGRHHTVLDIAKIIRSVLGAENVPLRFIGDRPGQVTRHTCNPAKTKRLIGWEAKTTLEEGLKGTIAWYKENESWWRPQLWLREVPIVTASGKREMH